MIISDCCKCSKTFTSQDAYQDHVLTVQSAIAGPFACYQCDLSFPNQCGLWSHNKLHTGEPQHMCKYCGRSFSQSDLLESHVHEHDVEFERLKVSLVREDPTISQGTPELQVADAKCIDDDNDDDNDDIIVCDDIVKSLRFQRHHFVNGWCF